MKTLLHWFRRDLRVADNVALSEAARRAETVIPIFILETVLPSGAETSAARLAFLLQSVECLRQNLQELGYPLIFRVGLAEEILPQLCRETGAQAVFANKGNEPAEQRRDERVTAALLKVGRGCEWFKDALIWEESEILTQAGKPYTVFTPYAKAWLAKPIPPPRAKLPVRKLKGEMRQLQSDRLPATPDELGWPLTQTIPPGGERAARTLLCQFLAGPVYAYGVNRDFPAVAGTSNLSPHLCAGTIGIRTILAELKTAREKLTSVGAEGTQRKSKKSQPLRMSATTSAASCDGFLKELIWREFYGQVLHHFPHVVKGAFRPAYDRLAWSDNQDHFAAWCGGRTGYPIVDAAMRCLNATGTMPNRLRMIVAMFLTKDLLINWQWGERYFMRQLVDGDLAANNGGWQWGAGTGTDAAPYFRIFNPVSQGEKFDPQGTFVRRWLPELNAFPAAAIQQPWINPVLLAKTNYPLRIVRHEEQRVKCLAMFQAVKRTGQ